MPTTGASTSTARPSSPLPRPASASTPVSRVGVPLAYGERTSRSSSASPSTRTAAGAAWSMTPAESTKNRTRGVSPPASRPDPSGGRTRSTIAPASTAERNSQSARRTGTRASSAANARAAAVSASGAAPTGSVSARSTSSAKHSSLHTTHVTVPASVAVDPTRAVRGTWTAPSRCTSRS